VTRIARLGTMLLAALMLLVAPAARADAAADPARQILVMIQLAPPHFRASSGYAGGYGEDASRAGRQRVAERIARRHGLRLAGNWPMPIIGIDCFIMNVPEGRTTEAVAAEVSRDPGVDWSEPVALYQAQGQPADNDPLLAAQPATRFWHLEALHKVATGRGAKVAVIDSQVDTSHPDLVGQVALARDFVTGHPSIAEDHGTGIAGVIAAKAGNGLGIAGIAPRARLLALRACWQQSKGATPPTICDSLSLAKAVSFAVEQRADVINMSLSGPPNRLLATLLRAGMGRGAAIVAAYDSALPGGGFPASLAGVLAIAGETVGGTGGPYSAPGRDVPTTQPGGRWYLVNGASYAAAQVSGLLALLRERRATGSARPALVSARQGGGEIDACATLVGNANICGRASLRRTRRAALALGLFWLVSTPARAQISGSLTVTSDERWRGRSLSAGQPAATAALSYDDRSGFYVDAAATGALIDDGVRLIGGAADAGYAWRLPSDVSLDIGITHRQFTRYFSGGRSTGYSEVYAGVNGRSLSASVRYSPNYFRRGASMIYGSVDGVLRPAPRWRVIGHVGAITYLNGPAVPRLRSTQYDYSLGVARQQGRVELRLAWTGGGPYRDYYDGGGHSKKALVLSAAIGF
jgi:uncharacterized protein (TIGR02001 family)